MSELSLGLYFPKIKTENISEHQVKELSCFLNEKEEKRMEDLPKILISAQKGVHGHGVYPLAS